jgi:flagellar protein FliS
MYPSQPNPFHAVSSYQNVGVQTASPARLVCLLYGTFDARLAALEELAQTGAPLTANMLNRPLEVLTELEHSLDMEQGQSIAANLFNLYRYMRERLQSRDNVLDNVREVRRLLAPLQAAWNELAAAPQPQAAAVTAQLA